jgi:hypothetical protein
VSGERGHHDPARDQAQEALDRARTAALAPEECDALGLLVVAYLGLGDYRTTTANGFVLDEGGALTLLAQITKAQGDHARAVELACRAAEHHLSTGVRTTLAELIGAFATD